MIQLVIKFNSNLLVVILKIFQKSIYTHLNHKRSIYF